MLSRKSGRQTSPGRKLQRGRSAVTHIFVKWEFILFLIFILVNVVNANISPGYMSVGGLFNATVSFLERAFLALGMVYILILGEIDISVGSQVALSAVVMAELYNRLAVPLPLAVLLCLVLGACLGLINGLILTALPELAPMIVTLATQILYRGIALIILGDQASAGLSKVSWFSALYWGKVGIVPYMFFVFLLATVIVGVLLHRTTFGRAVYAVGSNRACAECSGVRVKRVRLIVYTLMGFFCALTAVFLTARMGSARPNVAMGYEMDAISMCVLGGVMTEGGRGSMLGAVLAIFTLGFLRYGLGLINVQSQLMLVIVGALLILAVLVPNVSRSVKRNFPRARRMREEQPVTER